MDSIGENFVDTPATSQAAAKTSLSEQSQITSGCSGAVGVPAEQSESISTASQSRRTGLPFELSDVTRN